MESNGVGKAAMKAEGTLRSAASLFIGAAVIVLIVLWAYWPALDAPFVFDDIPNILNSPAIHWTEFSWENIISLLDSSRLQNRPIANLSFALDHLVGGLEPAGFHLTNVLIHLAVGAALMWLCVLYNQKTATATGPVASNWHAAALVLLPIGIFLLHPLNTQAVTYVVQRMTSLATLFTLLAFCCYLMGRYRVTSRSRWWYVGSLCFLFLGLGSKENSVLLLPLVLLYEICFMRAEWCQRLERALGVTWGRKWTVRAWGGLAVVFVLAFWIVAASSGVIGLTDEFHGRDYNGLERLMTQARVMIFHLSQLVWPVPGRLNLDHDFTVSRGLLEPMMTLPAILACGALIVLAVMLAVYRPRYGFPVIAYALLHSIEAGPIGLEIIFEHRMYMPMTMLCLAAAVLVVDASLRSRRYGLILMFLSLFVLAGWTHERNEVWADPLEFQRDIAVKSPNKARVQNNFALALYEAGRSEEALPVSQRAIDLDRDDPRLLKVLGDILVDLERPAEAVNVFRTAIAMDPANVRFVLGLGAALLASGDEEAAFLHYLGSGVTLARNGRPWEAITILKEAVRLRAADARARNALGNTYSSAGLKQQAIEQFRLAIEIDPEKFEAYYNLGLVADELGQREEAMRAFQGFLERAPVELQQHIERARARVEALSMGGNR